MLKPLEWVDETERNYDGYTHRLTVALAAHPFGAYRLEFDDSGTYSVRLGSSDVIENVSIDEAKAAAQADYERRMEPFLAEIR